MYKTTVSVPRITAATLHDLERTLPGLSFLTKIPLVNNKAEAVKVATAKMNASLPSQHCVSGVEESSETETGWAITFKIFD